MTKMLTIVPAGAGSGKTFRIKSNLTQWVKGNFVAPDRIPERVNNFETVAFGL